MAAVALVDNRPKIPTETGQRGVCIGPECRSTMVAKVGNVVRPHWAHTANAACGLDDTGEAGWHLAWRSVFVHLGATTEVVIGNHRADIQLADGRIIEFQTTFLTPTVISSREQAYGEMAWLYRMTEEPYVVVGETLTSTIVAWNNPTPSILAHRRPVYMQWYDTVWHVAAIDEGPTRAVWHVHLEAPVEWVEFSEQITDGLSFGPTINSTALTEAIGRRTKEQTRSAYSNTATMATLIDESACRRGGGKPTGPTAADMAAATVIAAKARPCEVCGRAMVVGQQRHHYTCTVPA